MCHCGNETRGKQIEGSVTFGIASFGNDMRNVGAMICGMRNLGNEIRSFGNLIHERFNDGNVMRGICNRGSCTLNEKRGIRRRGIITKCAKCVFALKDGTRSVGNTSLSGSFFRKASSADAMPLCKSALSLRTCLPIIVVMQKKDTQKEFVRLRHILYIPKATNGILTIAAGMASGC